MIPAAYYNEIDPFAAQWLRNLIADGHIAPGEVDERSIEDVTPDDLRGFTQCHFFAGIGVWSHSLRLAGWPDSRPVWTGSCPCQPFSQSGKRRGFNDPRHLWPTWRQLIKECAPYVIFGEQVASKDGLTWFDAVQLDLEEAEYAVAVVDLCAAGFGAPHIRQRLFWVADADSQCMETPVECGERGGIEFANGCSLIGLAHPDNASPVNSFWRDADWLFCRDGKWRPVKPGTFPLVDGAASRLGRVEPGVARVASSNRVGRLKGYGNAINAQAAAEFIRAYMGVSYGR
ncbi:DNA cytosine methyltransferase [Salmonella enterica]|uniref:DNA cytosine methyltransferase n=1 Tax=Salmonella enterica TaxID=28901 RepID=UPI0012755D1C|nr:DNA cytosine methyltransferase [Salmonella enterica subsp. enterica serovar Muenster]EDB3343877.1 DNA cytosine methyltransferase [Salmonella enterica subsp. enterica serovar Give]EDU6230995.1 DNA cytosine methyltransferase [Salmonella enterica subsp. enterica serovar Newbrunswick]EJT0872347.1 DNA cytosine methyltransferase [Salmonella enterica]EKQ0495022.1 DNA cytosine methyltransferase [Salmonella enterica]